MRTQLGSLWSNSHLFLACLQAVWVGHALLYTVIQKLRLTDKPSSLRHRVSRWSLCWGSQKTNGEYKSQAYVRNLVGTDPEDRHT